MIRQFLIILLLLLASCGSNQKENLRCFYLVIPDRYSQTDNIVDAYEYAKQLLENNGELTSNTCDFPVPIYIHSGQGYLDDFGPVGGYATNYENDTRDEINIFDWGVTDTRILAEMLAHEMGHILGYPHSDDPENIMFMNWTPSHKTKL